MSTPRKTLLAIVIGASLTGIPVYAAEEAEKLEKITVTGSRIARIDVEGATPLVVISREDIEDSGFMTIADVLQSSTYNSLGSYSAEGNNSWGSQATINLRGLGGQNTLVLIDGRRVPWSGVMYGGTVDVNAIPAAAVERIEIMPDGASAIYGSDAVAGVVNIIMRKEYDGLQVSGRVGRPDSEGADESAASLLWGASGDKGNLLISYEHDTTENIIMADRSYSKATNLDANDIYKTIDLSQTARTVYQVKKWTYKPIAGSCKKANFYGPYDDSQYPGDKVCGYDYTAVADLAPEITRNSINILGTYELNNDIQFDGGFSIATRDAANAAAPIPGSFTIDGTTVGGAKFFADNGLDTNLLDNNGKPTAVVKYRFDQLGNRVYEIDALDLSGHAGLSGGLELDFLDDFIWSVNYAQSKNSYTSNGTNMLLKKRVSTLAEENADFFLANGDINSKYLPQIRHTWVDNVEVESQDLNAGFGFSLGELPGGTISYYIGGQFNRYELEKTFDPLSSSGVVDGVFGGTFAGKRTVKAAYGEVLLPFTEEVEVSAAIRQDNYSDFGNTTNPKIAVRYQPMDSLLFRGSYGTSFKAPDFAQLYTPSNTGYYKVTDYKQCADKGISITDCNIQSDDTAVTSVGNKELQPEETQTLNVGLVFQPNDELIFRMNAFGIKTDKLIKKISSDYILQREAIEGGSSAVLRNDQGRISQVVTGSVNVEELEMVGLDSSMEYNLDLNSAGKMDFAFSGTYTLKYEYADEPGFQQFDHMGLDGIPEYRANATIGYNTPQDMHRFAISAYHIADQYDTTNVKYNNGKIESIENDGHIASHTTFNVNYRINLPWDAVGNVGVRNLLDRGPSFAANRRDFNSSLYGIKGRVIFANYTQSF